MTAATAGRLQRRLARRVVPGLALVLVALAGCGEDTPPAEKVPALADRLDGVDRAIAAGDPDDARDALDALVAEAARAEVRGEISDDQADAILAAVKDLLGALRPEDPEEDPSGQPEPEPPLGELDPGGEDATDQDDESDPPDDGEEKDD